jgi:hypothetical protein
MFFVLKEEKRLSVMGKKYQLSVAAFSAICTSHMYG